MNKKRHQPSDDEIDTLVEAQADDDAAWDHPVTVRRAQSSSVLATEMDTKLSALIARLAEREPADEITDDVINAEISASKKRAVRRLP